MSDSDSDSGDELGLFSFANKKHIVADIPSGIPITDSIQEDAAQDFALFQPNGKRKRTAGPLITEESVPSSQDISLADTSLGEVDQPVVNEETLRTAAYIDSIIKIDESALENPECTIPTTKRYKKSVEKRVQMMSALDGVINKFISTTNQTSADIDQTVQPGDSSIEDPSSRCILVKLRKGSELHRFKITMGTPLANILPYIAPKYSTTPRHMILQLNDETIDANKTPFELGITVADIIEVLVSAVPLDSSVAEDVPMENAIRIKVQSAGHRNNNREYTVLKNKPLAEYLIQVCKDFGYEAAKYLFDGESINPASTPEQLEMEESDCIDIVQM